jgi:hypothetical protein
MKTWRIQKFFGDVVYDLRNRGLLPVVILLVVAMVAVPLLISRGNSSFSSASLQPTANTKPAPEAQQAVLAYNPAGIRNYKSRLNDLSTKDPFRLQFIHSAAAASKLNSTVSPTQVDGTSSTDTTSNTTINGGSGGKGGSGGSGGKKHKKSVTVTYQTNVLAGEVDSQLTPFPNIAEMTTLPSPDKSVLVYFGLSSDHSHALFLVSNKVVALSGPGVCVPAPDDCALLSLAVGQSEDLQYAPDGKTYRVVVAEIKRFTK